MCFRTVTKAEIQILPSLEEYRWTLGAGQLHGDRALILHTNPSGGSVITPCLLYAIWDCLAKQKIFFRKFGESVASERLVEGLGCLGSVHAVGLVGCGDLAML